MLWFDLQNVNPVFVLTSKQVNMLVWTLFVVAGFVNTLLPLNFSI